MAFLQSFPLKSSEQIILFIRLPLKCLPSSSGCYEAASLSYPLYFLSCTRLIMQCQHTVRQFICKNKDLSPNSGCSGMSSFGEQSYFTMWKANHSHLLYETVLRNNVRVIILQIEKHHAAYNCLYHLTYCMFMSSLHMRKGPKAKGRESLQESICSWKVCGIKIPLLLYSTARIFI